VSGPAGPGCAQAREDAALALLAGRPPDDRTRRHLAGCPDCAREADRLAPLPDLLDLVRDPALRPVDDQPPAELLERLLGQVRRRRRTRRLALGAAAAALLLPAGLAGWHELGESRAPDATRAVAAGADPVVVRRVADPATGAWMTVELRAAARGSDLTVSVGGLPAGVRCRLLALTRTGSADVAGSWTASAADTWTVHGSVAARSQDLTAVQIVDESTGRVLLPVRLA
jgi:hypothetical protein